ncbi:MAG: AIR synthase family protein [Lachnospiraceae bacterium]|nr:AIR synthase family protein [Lachnospiraceae bacterium]
MKIGKVPENILKRSVMKQLHYKRDEVLMGPSIGEDCTALKLEDDEIVVMSTDPITGTANDIGNLAIQVTANDLASSGAEPIGVMLTILLPDGTREIKLKRIMEQMEVACAAAHIQIMGGHTEVTSAVTRPVVNVVGVGKTKVGRMISTAGARPGMDIVLTKWIGIEGTTIIAKEKEEELKEHFSSSFVDGAKELDKYLSVVPEAMVAVENNVAAMHDITEGGVYGALWEMAEASGVGLEADLKAIPIKQETVEICEYYDVNPYGLISSGSMLMAAEDGAALVKAIEDAGINAAVIGKFTDSNDRVIVRDDDRRFLEPPKTDELYKVC